MKRRNLLLMLVIISLFSTFLLAANAHPGQYRDKLEGFDFNKLDDPNHQTIKYRAGRVFEHFLPNSNVLNAVIAELRNVGLNPTKVGFDEIDFNDGNGAVDVIRASDVEGGGEAWQWIVVGRPSHAPTLRVISPNGGEVFETGSTVTVTWTSKTFSSNTIPSANLITVQFIKSTGETFTFFATPNDYSEKVFLSKAIIPGLYKARIYTNHEGKTIEDESDDFFRVIGPNNPPVISSCTTPSTVTVGDIAIITYSVSDPDGDSFTVTIDWGDGTTSTGGTSSASHVYSSTGAFVVIITATDSKGAITSTKCGTIKVVSVSNKPPIIHSCSPNKPNIIVGQTAVINYAISDPEGDSFTVTIDWGDGTTSTGGLSSAFHTYTSTGTFTVTIKATDSKGAATSTTCGSITVTSTANNPPVISSCTTPSTVTVGDTAIITYSVSDPEGDFVTVVIDWGDGTTSTGGTSSASHVYTAAGTYIVTVTATDSKGAAVSRTCKTINVLQPKNNPPIVSFCSPLVSPIKVGELATVNYLVSDPEGDFVTVVIDWGDGTSSIGFSSFADHFYNLPGTYSVRITATDSKGAVTKASCGTIKVLAAANQPPIIVSCLTPSTAVRGMATTITYSVSDPEGDSFSVTIDWGDGTTSTGGLSSASHTYTSIGTFTVTIKATDSKGAVTSTVCGTITITSTANNPPIVASCGPSVTSVPLGSIALINYIVTDPDNDPVTIFIDWGDGFTTLGSGGSATHVYLTTGTFAVTITAIDAKGASVTRTCGMITVTSPSNNPPVISTCSAPSSGTVGSAVSISYSVSDPEGDSFTVTIDWGDGTTSTGGLSSASHTYTSTGTFTVTIKATDSKGAAVSRTCGTITITSTGNNPPSIPTCSLSSSSISPGGTITATYSISDPDGDTFTVAVNWGDGSTSIGSSSSASHTYTSTGAFSVTVTATDSRGASSNRNCGSVSVSTTPPPPTTPSGARLKITDVDAEVDDRTSNNLRDNDRISKKAHSESRVEFKIEVKNLFNTSNGLKIEDVRVKTTIEGIDDGDDMEEESKEFDLRPQDDKSVTAKFVLPINVEEGTYTVFIEAEGEDTEGNSHSDSIDLDLEVEKEEHDLRFQKISLGKASIKCNESFTINYQIINLGEEDEEKAYVGIKSDELGIDLTQRDISIKSGTVGNTYSKSHSLKLGNKVEDGTYPIAVSVFSDEGKLQDAETLQLSVKDCGKIVEQKEKEEKTVTLVTSTTQVTGTQVTKDTRFIPIIDIFFNGRSSNFGLLLISTFILSTFFLIVAIVLLIRQDYGE